MSVDKIKAATKASVKYRRPLNNEQLSILACLYGYRFATASLLAMKLGKPNVKLVQKQLKVLEDQAFVAKHYDKTYKLQGRPAEYYLLPKGGRILLKRYPDDDTFTEQGIKALYRNKTASNDFMQHCLTVFRVRLQLGALYDPKSAKLKVYTQNSLHAYEYFPKWKPDLFLSLKSKTKNEETTRFFLDIFDGTKPFFVSVRKMRNYIQYSEEGDWPDTVSFPIVLAICESQRSETKLRRQIRKALEESYEEVIFATTTAEQFFDPDNKRGKVWRKVDDEELFTLRSLFVNS